MTNETPAQETVTPQAKPLTINDERISFTDYERLRRGEKVEVSEGVESAPAAHEAPEQKKSEESDASETEGKEDEKDESLESEEAEEGAEDSKEDGKDKPKKKGGFQRRIDKLNAAKAAAERELDYWKRRALEGAGEPKAKEDVEKPLAKQASQDGKPDPDKFETYVEYVEALADWKTEQKLKEREAEQQKKSLQTEQEQIIQAHTKRVKSFADKTEDFQDVLEAVDDIPVSPAVQEIILTSENGPELMYELAKNREEYARICKLSPLAAARELGRIESRLQKASEEKKPETKKLTQAPKPIEPVGGAAASVRKSISDPDLSFADYERLRREQLKRKRG